MNVQATAVERRTARPLVPRFHSSFSIGAAIGSGLAALLVTAGAGVALHLIVVMVVVVVAAPLVTRMFVPDGSDEDDAIPAADEGGRFSAWREPRTLMIGFLVFAFAFAESVGNDWLSVGIIDGEQVPRPPGPPRSGSSPWP